MGYQTQNRFVLSRSHGLEASYLRNTIMTSGEDFKLFGKKLVCMYFFFVCIFFQGKRVIFVITGWYVITLCNHFKLYMRTLYIYYQVKIICERNTSDLGVQNSLVAVFIQVHSFEVSIQFSLVSRGRFLG